MTAGQSPFKLGIQPLAAFMILALGAMAVAAGAVDQVFLAAVIALIDGDAVLPGPAVDDGLDGLFMLPGRIRIPGKVFRSEGAEDLGDSAHDYTPCMTALMI